MSNLILIALAVGTFLITKIILFCICDVDTSDAVEKEKMKCLAKKAIRDDAYLLKYVERTIREEYEGDARINVCTATFRVFSVESIKTLLLLLKDNRSYNNSLEYQKDCVERIDRMKNIIRNCYQSEKPYKKAAERLLSYLSIIEVGLLTGPLNNKDWNDKVYFRYIFDNIYWHNRESCDESKEKTPEEWTEEMKEKKVRPEEWCDLLLEDLKLLETYYGLYRFNESGWLYFYN